MLDKLVACVLGSKTYMASVSLEQKKLEQLKQQLFGKSDSTYSISPKHLKSVLSLKTQTVTTYAQNNLRADLAKIAILSLGAIAIQFGLYLANLYGLIKLF